MDMMMVLAEAVGKLFLALVLAGILGLERGRRGYSAGLRTHVLVCLGSTLAMIVTDVLAREAMVTYPTMLFDKTRVAAGIITGVGFLGAGTIINVGTTQRGLTTAAMIWFVANLGIAIGVGYYWIAVTATAFAVVVALGLEMIEEHLPTADRFLVAIRMPSGLQRMEEIERAIRDEGFKVETSRLKITAEGEEVDMTFQIVSKSRKHIDQLALMLETRFPSAKRIVCER